MPSETLGQEYARIMAENAALKERCLRLGEILRQARRAIIGHRCDSRKCYCWAAIRAIDAALSTDGEKPHD